MFEGSSYSGNIDWNDILKKEAEGINNEDLGEVQEVTQDYVLVEKGVINREKFYTAKMNNKQKTYQFNQISQHRRKLPPFS